jgi:hypothetical protein
MHKLSFYFSVAMAMSALSNPLATQSPVPSGDREVQNSPSRGDSAADQAIVKRASVTRS